MRVTGVIQAGGRSTRMGGEPKALITVGGQRIIERVMHAVASAVDDVLVVTNTPDLYAFLGVPMVPDAFPDHGSLGGIYSGLQAASGDAAFTVACDMPFLSPAVVRLVVARAGQADVVIPRVGGQLQALHALYARACLPHVEERLRAGQLKIAGFFEHVSVLEIPEEELAGLGDPARAFMNVNTPDELERARALADPPP
ncbi:MAG: molybdenum cofactor guanylyltransferase [Candidatus Rokuibacteriota bacterium]